MFGTLLLVAVASAPDAMILLGLLLTCGNDPHEKLRDASEGKRE